MASTRPRLTAVLMPALLLALLAALVRPAAGSARSAAKPQSCNIASVAHALGPTTVSSLRVTNVACPKGIAIVKAFHKCRTSHGKAGHCVQLVQGYACQEQRHNFPTEIEGSVVCKKGTAVVSHKYVQTL
jgi:hypothetical protein